MLDIVHYNFAIHRAGNDAKWVLKLNAIRDFVLMAQIKGLQQLNRFGYTPMPELMV